MKLSVEEKELLQEFMESPYAPLVQKVLAALCRGEEENVLRCESSDPQKLVRSRAHGEGARKLLSAWELALVNLKPKHGKR